MADCGRRKTTVLVQPSHFLFRASGMPNCRAARLVTLPMFFPQRTRRDFGGKRYQSTIDACRGQAHASAVGSEDTRIALEPLVSIVDDDESVRESLPDLITEFGFAARTFSSPKEFLLSSSVDKTRCLIVDISMPGMTGPELHEELKRRGQAIPIIFITGQQDDIIRARLVEQGAAGFLLKPFSDSDLLEAIKTALQGT